MAGALVVAMATKVSRTDQKPMAWKLWTCCVAGNVLVSYGIEGGGEGWEGLAVATSVIRRVAAAVTKMPMPKRHPRAILLVLGSEAWKSIGIGIQRRNASVTMLHARIVQRIAGDDSG